MRRRTPLVELENRKLWRLMLSTLTAAVLSGCPGTLEDAKKFQTEGGGGPAPCGDVFETIIKNQCGSSLCHGGPDAGGTLDLTSPDPGTRLIDVMAAGEQCGTSGRVYIDSANPSGSLLLEKIEEMPSCGERMPNLPVALTPAQKACVAQWVEELAGGGGTLDASAATTTSNN